tara:strand:- start:102 stop:644 length:543 start_codon:yes stop_codon:yes gene_type:complete
VDEKKLQSYKLKKLKSQFVYLRDVLQEDQYIYELALEKFYNDFTEPLSDEKVQKVKTDQKAQQQQVKEKKILKLYHRIAGKTHPDKLLHKDITEDEKEELESMYKIATEASVKNNYDDLVAIAVRLGFEDVYESEDYLNKSIDKINDKIKKLKTTYAWVWYHADDDKKELIRAKIIESYK